MTEHSERALQLMAQYRALAHAMQTGVAMMENFQPADYRATKHLRVGINTAMSDHGALVALLIEKGVFTEEEYAEKLVEFMQREVDSYTRDVARATGADPDRVHLA